MSDNEEPEIEESSTEKTLDSQEGGKSISAQEGPTGKNLKGQLFALLTLIAVFGLLYGLVKYLPTAGNRLGEKISTFTEGENSPPASEKAKPEAESKTPTTAQSLPSGQRPETSKELKSPDASGSPVPEESARNQITEALGGSSRVLVRHIAFSDDEERMIASIKLINEEGYSKLVEVLFQRDEFGRYVSAEDSPLESPLTIWK